MDKKRINNEKLEIRTLNFLEKNESSLKKNY